MIDFSDKLSVRIYDKSEIAKLTALMEREQAYYQSKNDFLSALLMIGCDCYIAAAKKADAEGGTDIGSARPETIRGIVKEDTGATDTYNLVKDMCDYIIMQFKGLSLYHEINQDLTASNYRMLLSLIGGEKVLPSKIEQGFFDDLPARFEAAVVSLDKELTKK
jgi:hypothetical protein